LCAFIGRQPFLVHLVEQRFFLGGQDYALTGERGAYTGAAAANFG
jgi:hypothetical protein